MASILGQRNDRLPDLSLGRGKKTFSLRLLASALASAASRVGLFANAFLRWLLIRPPRLHLPEYAFSLHLSLQSTKGLIDVVIYDAYLQNCSLRLSLPFFRSEWLSSSPNLIPLRLMRHLSGPTVARR